MKQLMKILGFLLTILVEIGIVIKDFTVHSTMTGVSLVIPLILAIIMMLIQIGGNISDD